MPLPRERRNVHPHPVPIVSATATAEVQQHFSKMTPSRGNTAGTRGIYRVALYFADYNEAEHIASSLLTARLASTPT